MLRQTPPLFRIRPRRRAREFVIYWFPIVCKRPFVKAFFGAVALLEAEHRPSVVEVVVGQGEADYIRVAPLVAKTVGTVAIILPDGVLLLGILGRGAVLVEVALSPVVARQVGPVQFDKVAVARWSGRCSGRWQTCSLPLDDRQRIKPSRKLPSGESPSHSPVPLRIGMSPILTEVSDPVAVGKGVGDVHVVEGEVEVKVGAADKADTARVPVAPAVVMRIAFGQVDPSTHPVARHVGRTAAASLTKEVGRVQFSRCCRLPRAPRDDRRRLPSQDGRYGSMRMVPSSPAVPQSAMDQS